MAWRGGDIILFGSHAPREATCDSDFDLLIIMDQRGSRRQTANEIDLLLANRARPIPSASTASSVLKST